MITPVLSDYFLEILGRGGNVSERVSLGEHPITIGRAYDCQVIVDDPYVCPQHVKVTLTENNALLIEDLDSINGLAVSRHGTKQKRLTLRSGDDCFIGGTKIRYRCRNDQLLPTQHDHSRQFIFTALQKPAIITLIILFTFFLLFFAGWMEQAREVELHTLFIGPASVYVFLIIWAFVWSMAGKLIVHHAMFFTHLAIISALITIMATVEGITGYSVFMLDIDLLQKNIQYVTGFFIIAAVIYTHLHFASRGKPKVLIAASMVVAIMLIAVSAYIDFESESQFSSSPQYSALLKPPVFVIGSVQTTDEFLQGMDSLEHAVDKLKQSEANKKE